MDNHAPRNLKSQNSKIDNSEEARKADALSLPEVRRGMREAWERSEADAPEKRHEEGGYIGLCPDGSLQVVPWPQGERGLIEMPERNADGKYKGIFVISSYHTHPNPTIDEEGRRWEQSPSEIDIEMIIREKYSGDSFVISNAIVYRVKPDGRVEEVGEREKTLS
ncbi:hypothetical protein FJZ31_36165 [Candidatus Poribacteria bacterium]|nr:hypothetical protein [Candidatus Poribacteria bacterium]